MTKMTIESAAKINLALDVTGKLPNGYHTIESVFQTVGIYDTVTAELNGSGKITIECQTPDSFALSDPIPCDERNIAYKAAKLFFGENNLNCGCGIHIKKGIPSQAGMGGGSSDAAAVLYILNRLTELNISSAELAKLGARLGADVPFFLTGGTAYVSGIGEKITPIRDYSGKILVIAKGADGVSTAEAYRSIDSLVNPTHPDVEKLLYALKSGEDAYEFFGNIFEEAVQLKSVDEIREKMLECNALAAHMTGSGSAVFGMFGSLTDAEKCASELSSEGFFAQACRTVKGSL